MAILLATRNAAEPRYHHPVEKIREHSLAARIDKPQFRHGAA
jgi:hypothetical protein